MPYSISSYQNFGSSPFQQYQDQQQQFQLQQQQNQLQQQQNQLKLQNQQNPAFGGQQPTLGGGITYGGQQQYGGWPSSGQQQYNPLPTYNTGGQQNKGPDPNNYNDPRWWPSGTPGMAAPLQNQGSSTRLTQATGLLPSSGLNDSSNPYYDVGAATFMGTGGSAPQSAGYNGYYPSYQPPQTNPYQTNQQNQPFQYTPLQPYNFGGGSPSGGTGNYSMFNYF